MRTLIIIAGGVTLLGLGLLGARLAGGADGRHLAAVARVFLIVWLAAALVNMWIGVARAGYSVAEELPIFLVIYAMPGVVAGFVWWKFS